MSGIWIKDIPEKRDCPTTQEPQFPHRSRAAAMVCNGRLHATRRLGVSMNIHLQGTRCIHSPQSEEGRITKLEKAALFALMPLGSLYT